MIDPLLGPKQVARLLGVTQRTLRNWRQGGRGPAWIRLSHGVYRYPEGGVQAWIDAREGSATSG